MTEEAASRKTTDRVATRRRLKYEPPVTGRLLPLWGEPYHLIPSSRSVDGGQVDSRACAAYDDGVNSAGRSITPMTECFSLVIGYRDLVGLPVGDCKCARRKILADHNPVLRERGQVAVQRGARGVDRFHRNGGIAWWGRVGVCVDCRNRGISCDGYRAIPVGRARVQPVVKEVIPKILDDNCVGLRVVHFEGRSGEAARDRFPPLVENRDVKA